MKSNWISNLSTGILALCAVIVTGLLVHRELRGAKPAPAGLSRTVDDWRQYTNVGRRIGRQQDGLVTLVEFSDFQCPFCKSLNAILSSVMSKNPDVVHEFRYYPLTAVHPYALMAAVAAECAGQQSRFTEYHDVLFAQQDSIGKRAWNQFAKDAGVPDMHAFEDCVRDTASMPRVKNDMAAGGKLALTGTPSLLINGTLVMGTLSAPALQQLIDEARRHIQ